MTQLEKAHHDLRNSENKVAALNIKMAKKKLKKQSSFKHEDGLCYKGFTDGENKISELMLQLKAHRDLEKCTAKLRFRVDDSEEAKQEQHEKVAAFGFSSSDSNIISAGNALNINNQ